MRQRADPDRLHRVFEKYASVEKNGEKFMTAEDFIIKYLGLFDPLNYNDESVQLLAAIVNSTKTGFISYPEFQAFEGQLCFPDALYQTAFQLFDANGNGVVSFGRYSIKDLFNEWEKGFEYICNSFFYFGLLRRWLFREN